MAGSDKKERDRRIWQQFVTDNAVAEVACIGYDEGMEQVAALVFPKGSDKSFFFCGLTGNRQRDIPEAVSRLVESRRESEKEGL